MSNSKLSVIFFLSLLVYAFGLFLCVYFDVYTEVMMLYACLGFCVIICFGGYIDLKNLSKKDRKAMAKYMQNNPMY